MKELRLADAALGDGAETRALAEALAENGSLELLDLRRNALGARRAAALLVSRAEGAHALASLPLSRALSRSRALALCSLPSLPSLRETHVRRPGAREELNFVNPEVVTGAEAIADALARNARLRALDLSWNLSLIHI